MIVRLRLNVPDEVRRAIRHAGRRRGKGLATRQEIVEELEQLIDAHWDDLVSDYDNDRG